MMAFGQAMAMPQSPYAFVHARLTATDAITASTALTADLPCAP